MKEKIIFFLFIAVFLVIIAFARSLQEQIFLTFVLLAFSQTFFFDFFKKEEEKAEKRKKYCYNFEK